MNANTYGKNRLISEATDLIKAGIGVGLWDPNAHSASVGTVTDIGVLDTLLEFSPDDELVIPLTAESGLVALEVDPVDGGLDSLKPLLDKGLLPARTPIMNTAGKDKSCLFFRFKGPRTKSRVTLGAGLELIAADGFVVVPPRHASNGQEGRWKHGYHPADMPVAELPAQFAALL